MKLIEIMGMTELHFIRLLYRARAHEWRLRVLEWGQG